MPMPDLGDTVNTAIGFVVGFLAVSAVSILAARIFGVPVDEDDNATARIDTITRKLLTNIGLS